MSVKTNGAEWLRFYNDSEYWKEGWYHDDTLIEINGVEYGEGKDFDWARLTDGDVVVVKEGYVVKGNVDSIVSLESHFKSWRKKQDTMFISVECPKDKFDAIAAAIKAAGGVVRK